MVDPEKVRSLLRAEPFQRFTLVTSTGERIEVKHRGGIGMAPDGSSLFFSDHLDALRRIKTATVADVIVEPPLSPEVTESIETIRQLRNASPFVPFAVLVDDGRKFLVDRSFRIAIPPGGREICYAVSPIDFQRIPSHRVKEVIRDAK